MDSKRWFVMLLAILAIFLGVPAVQANLIVNGSFTAGVAIPSPPGFVTIEGGDSISITDWTVTGQSIDYIGNYWAAAPGCSRSLDLDGTNYGPNGQLLNAQGGIQQTFATTKGLRYLVTFDLAGNYDGPPPIKTVEVQAAAGSAIYDFDIRTITSPSDMNWQLESFTFTANGPSTILSFASLTAGDFGPVLDNVKVSNIPLPATVLLMGSGIVGLAFLGWRRRNTRT